MGETTQGRTGKWAKRPGGETTQCERESGRNDSGANGKVGETTRIPTYISDPNLGHQATALNLLGWMCWNEGLLDCTLWTFAKSVNLEKHCNAAYLHLLVILSKEIGYPKNSANKEYRPITAGDQVTANKIQKLSSFKSNETIHKREDGSYYVVSANKASSVTL